MNKLRPFFEWEVRHPVIVLILIAVITVFFAVFGVVNFRIENPTERLLQRDLPSKQFYDRFIEMFGKDEIILIVVKTPDNVYAPEFIDALGGMEKELHLLNENLKKKFVLEKNPMRRIISLTSAYPRYLKMKDDFEERKKTSFILRRMEFPSFRESIEMITLFMRNLVSEDGKATAITIFVDSRQEDVVDGIQEILDRTMGKTDWQIYQTGTSVIARKVVKRIESDLKKLSGITIAVVAIILAICFRKARGVFLPALTVSIAAIWTIGFMGLLDRPMTMVTLIVPTLIIAIGNAYALHVVAEFMEEIRSGGEKPVIVMSSLNKLVLPVFLTVFTTLIGFASLALNRIDVIREFALFACFGLFVVFIMSMTFIPAMLTLLRMPSVQEKKETHLARKFLNSITDFDIRRANLIYILLGVFLVTAVVGVLRVDVQTAVISFFKKDDEVRLNFEDVSKTLSGAYPLNIVMISDTPGYFLDPAVLRKVEELQQYLENLPKIDKTISIADYIKTVNATLSLPPKQVIPDTLDDVKKITRQFKTVLGEDADEIYNSVTRDYSSINVVCRTAIDGTKPLLKAERKILDYCRQNFSKDLDIQVTGLPIVVAHSADSITIGQVKSLSLAFISIFIIMSLLFMSVKVGLVAMIPNVVPVMLNFAVMGFFRIPLSSATSLIASIALGIAVDDTIHFLARYNSEFKKDWNKERAIRETMVTVGQPIIFTAMTVGIGFAVLLLSSFQPTMLFGVLMVTTMVAAIFGDIIVLPALMLRTELVTAWDFVALKLGDLPRKRIPLFEGFSNWQAKKLLVAGKLEKYDSGAVVFKEGEMGDTMYAIISGGVDVIKGETEKVTSLGVGDIFGEMGLVRHKERSATVKTNQTTELLWINDATLSRIQRRFPRIGMKFYNNLTKILCERLDTTTRRLIERY